MRIGLTILLGTAGIAVATAAAYLLILAIASFFYRAVRRPFKPTRRLLVLIPAHDEAELIGRCLRSLQQQSYPRTLYRIVVIADNCADDTASLARSEGVEAWERLEPEHPGKGRALRWAMDRLAREPFPPDAVVVVDADSVVDPELLMELGRQFEAGSDAVQAEYLALADSVRLQPGLSSIGFLLFHRIRFAGRAVLGMPVNLVGNGMLFSRELLQRCPWDAFSSVEDLEYSVHLRLAGARPAFAGPARVYGPIASSGRVAEAQRRRWEGGRFFVVRTWLLKLVGTGLGRRNWSLLDAALDLAIPPLGLLVLVSVAGTALSALLAGAHLVFSFVLLAWLVAVVALPAYVVLGLRSAQAPATAYLALVGAPLFLFRKLLLYAKLFRHHDAYRWEPTGQPGAATPAPSRVRIAGVPVDAIDMQQALERLDAVLGTRRLTQVCTVNFDFLVRAQQGRQTRRIFERSELNLPDGFPVVWLGRLQGHRVPMRVAGADLVPELLRLAAARQAGVFFLGGEQGVAEAAARVLRRDLPGLTVAGWLEPPRAAIERMDNEEIVRRINESGADVLLVALGHPKQDQWIDQHRDRLRVSIAIGVGCCLDLIAGRVRRAPRWMQVASLEWLFRLGQEPTRLVGRYSKDVAWLAPILLRVCWLRFKGMRKEAVSARAA